MIIETLRKLNDLAKKYDVSFSLNGREQCLVMRKYMEHEIFDKPFVCAQLIEIALLTDDTHLETLVEYYNSQMIQHFKRTVEDAQPKICNRCEYYKGIHGYEGHAPCAFWHSGGVLWNDYCSNFVRHREMEDNT